MAKYFCDTSAIIKRYVNDVGSAWIDQIADPAAGHDIILVQLTSVEVTSAVMRRQRGGLIAPAAAASLLSQFQQDLAIDYHIIDVTAGLVASAVSLVTRHVGWTP